MLLLMLLGSRSKIDSVDNKSTATPVGVEAYDKYKPIEPPDLCLQSFEESDRSYDLLEKKLRYAEKSLKYIKNHPPEEETLELDKVLAEVLDEVPILTETIEK
jgi:hypothetical protein